MRPIPVPVDDVCLAVTVEVCQSDPSAVLHGVLHTYRDMVIHSVVHQVHTNQSTRQWCVKLRALLSPACCATSVKVPSPLFLNRKLGPYSLSQKTSDMLWLTMGPTTTPRPPAQMEKQRRRISRWEKRLNSEYEGKRKQDRWGREISFITKVNDERSLLFFQAISPWAEQVFLLTQTPTLMGHTHTHTHTNTTQAQARTNTERQRRDTRWESFALTKN